MTLAAAQPDLETVFPGSGEMALRCREMDWPTNVLGSVASWSAALRFAVRTALECPSPIALWCGKDLTLIYNDAYRPLLGDKHPASAGRSGPLVWSEIWAEIEPLFTSIANGSSPVFQQNARFVMNRKGGEADEAWFNFSLSPIRDDDGSIVAIMNTASETTAHVHAEEGIREAKAAAERAEHRLREVFSQAPAFLAVVRGPDHIFDFVNDAYTRLVGRRDLVGKTVVEALPEVRSQGFVELLDRVYETGKPYTGRDIPVMLSRSPGSEPEQRFLDFVYQPLTDEMGKTVGIVAHGSDVTDAVQSRHEMEQLWRDSEQARSSAEASEGRYRFLANAIPVQVWTATPEGTLDYVSARTAEYFGKTPEEVIGDQWLSVLHPDDLQRTMETWARSLGTGEPYQIEFRLKSAAENAYRWHLGRATAQRDEEGNIIRWFGTNTDIEDGKRAEEELQRLTNDAMEASRAKSDFLAAMSHELRTPLNAIGGYAQLIEMGLRGPVTEEQRADLLRIQRSKNHLDSLVSDVLNFAKAGAGRIEFRLGDVDVQKLLDSVLEMVAPQMIEKKLDLAPYLPATNLFVVADDDKMRQILLNLFANALKFTPADGLISVDIIPDESHVSVSVGDTGIGIPADQLEKIFEPFVQAKKALNTSDQGVGLGLAISRQLARAMNGDLTVASETGKGSRFTLTLPRSNI